MIDKYKTYVANNTPNQLPVVTTVMGEPWFVCQVTGVLCKSIHSAVIMKQKKEFMVGWVSTHDTAAQLVELGWPDVTEFSVRGHASVDEYVAKYPLCLPPLKHTKSSPKKSPVSSSSAGASSAPPPLFAKFKCASNVLEMEYQTKWDSSQLLSELIEAGKSGTLEFGEHTALDTETGMVYIDYPLIKKIHAFKIAHDMATKPDMGLTEQFGTDEVKWMINRVSAAVKNDSTKPMSVSNKRLAKQSNTSSCKTKRPRKDIKPSNRC